MTKLRGNRGWLGLIATIVVLLFANAAVASPMVFAEHFNGAMRIDGNSTWISAEGEITNQTPADFEKFLATATIWKRQRIAIDSPGGSVIGSIKLGEIIRAHEFLIGVGKSIKNGNYSSPAPGQCASACVFAFVGGIERSVVAPSRIGVHQIAISRQSLYESKAISVDELDRTFASSQIVIGLVISHFIKMGIDLNVVTLMTQTLPADVRWLSSEELKSARIDYDPNKFEDWAVEAYKSGLVAFTRSSNGARQLTLFCTANKMQFKLTANGAPYANDFVSSVGNPNSIEVAGLRIIKPNFNMLNLNGGMSSA